MLILAGIAGAVILGQREAAPPRVAPESAVDAAVHPQTGEETMDETTNRSQDASGVWTCPMHPEVRSDGPGKCPKCGMNLVPAESLGDKGGSQQG